DRALPDVGEHPVGPSAWRRRRLNGTFRVTKRQSDLVDSSGSTLSAPGTGQRGSVTSSGPGRFQTSTIVGGITSSMRSSTSTGTLDDWQTGSSLTTRQRMFGHPLSQPTE